MTNLKLLFGRAILGLITASFIAACGGGGGGNGGGGTAFNWLIPENEVVDGGPGKDGIPALKGPRCDREIG